MADFSVLFLSQVLAQAPYEGTTMVMDKPVYLTAEGKTSLEEELNH